MPCKGAVVPDSFYSCLYSDGFSVHVHILLLWPYFCMMHPSAPVTGSLQLGLYLGRLGSS